MFLLKALLKWIFLLAVAVVATLVIVMISRNFNNSEDQATNSEVMEDKPVSNQATTSHVEKPKKDLKGVEAAFVLALNSCFKNKEEAVGVDAGYVNTTLQAGYAYRATFAIPENTTLTQRVPRINGHTCQIYINKELDTIMAMKDVCQALCDIPVVSGSNSSRKLR